MTIRLMTAALVVASTATATWAQDTTVPADETVATVDCTLPENAELQACIDLGAFDATALAPILGPLVLVAAAAGGGGGGGNGDGGNGNGGGGGGNGNGGGGGGGGGGNPTTPVTPTTSGTN